MKQREDIYRHIEKSFHLLHENGKKIEDEAEAKNQFLSTMSHEIRTPLNGIVGFTKLLKELNPTKDQEEFLSLIENASNNLISIVNDVLDLSKMNAEKMEIESTSFDIFKTMELTIASFSQQADQKDIELGVLKYVPIIALTANTSAGDREKYIAEGMDDYAIKPLDVEALKSIISDYYVNRISSKNKVK